MSNQEGFITRLGKMRDETIADMTHELLTNPRFASALGAAVQRAAKTKRRFDRNVALVSSMAGIPSKRDYDRLAERAQGLEKNVSRLEDRIDSLALRLEKLGADLG
ncbi:MAG: hypothetical protein M5R36_13835 [Deltaproteobacteria bacterium]|nr:hypothetical protein [Deltaproteobacteria bacterium]